MFKRILDHMDGRRRQTLKHPIVKASLSIPFIVLLSTMLSWMLSSNDSTIHVAVTVIIIATVLLIGSMRELKYQKETSLTGIIYYTNKIGLYCFIAVTIFVGIISFLSLLIYARPA